MLYMTYSKLANKMAGISKRDEATVIQLNNLSLMEHILLHEINLGIMQGTHYKDIYRNCKKRLEMLKDIAYLESACGEKEPAINLTDRERGGKIESALFDR